MVLLPPGVFGKLRMCATAFLMLFLALTPASPENNSETNSAAAAHGSASGKTKAPEAAPDTLVFENGDHLSGKLLRVVGETVWFHSEYVGEIHVKWSQLKEIRTATKLVVLEKGVSPQDGKLPPDLPEGTLAVSDGSITVRQQEPPGAEVILPIKRAEYVLDETTLRKQIEGHPGILGGWNGQVTAGATVVQATQNQYTFTGAMALARVVPTVAWLNTRNRTSLDFNGSFGKIIQPPYASGGVMTPGYASKSSIYHADAERDEYFSPRFYALGQTVFDHNFAQDLDLQQIYGAGIGWTAVKRPEQELDLKTTLQYESQQFIVNSRAYDQNLIGSTLDGTWSVKLPLKVLFRQQVSWIPAYNNPYAYSAGETNTLTMPFFKRLAFSVGSIDSYLNDPPPSSPPTRRNSFEFTTGLTYAIKSNY
ncbi:MAG TPA: DUF481 domain-containing protein [Acidobacteriaceae bacterium]|nr:DUF481 domain-containing protein [Acidobacteriaceae bacterium]